MLRLKTDGLCVWLGVRAGMIGGPRSQFPEASFPKRVPRSEFPEASSGRGGTRRDCARDFALLNATESGGPGHRCRG